MLAVRHHGAHAHQLGADPPEPLGDRWVVAQRGGRPWPAASEVEPGHLLQSEAVARGDVAALPLHRVGLTGVPRSRPASAR